MHGKSFSHVSLCRISLPLPSVTFSFGTFCNFPTPALPPSPCYHHPPPFLSISPIPMPPEDLLGWTWAWFHTLPFAWHAASHTLAICNIYLSHSVYIYCLLHTLIILMGGLWDYFLVHLFSACISSLSSVSSFSAIHQHPCSLQHSCLQRLLSSPTPPHSLPHHMPAPLYSCSAAALR